MTRARLLATAVGASALALAPAAQSVEEGATYPYRLYPIDAIRGHLMEGDFREPAGVYFDPTHRELYVADMKNALIGIFDERGVPLYAFGEGGLLVQPSDVVAQPDGSIFVLDNDRTAVAAFDYRGEPRPRVTFADEEGRPLRIEAFAIGPAGRWYVADANTQRVLVYGADAQLELVIPREDDVGSFEVIAGIAVSDDGLVAVIDRQGTPVQIFDRLGRFVSGFGKRDIGVENFTAPRAAAFDDEGYLYVVDMLRHDVKIFDTKGVFQGMFGGWFSPQTRGRGPGEMLYPIGITIAPEGAVYVAERFGNRVQVFERRAADAADPPPAGPETPAGEEGEAP